MPSHQSDKQPMYFNKQALQINPWTLLHHASAQSTRLAEQSKLPCQVDSNNLETNTSVGSLPSHLLVDLHQWKSYAAQPLASKPILGLIVNGFDEIETIQTIINETILFPSVIFIDFPVFSDGRGYSLAHVLLRDSMLKLPIGAIGDILQDQIFFYWRCGFEVLIPRYDQNFEACAANFKSFSHAYQPSQCQPL